MISKVLENLKIASLNEMQIASLDAAKEGTNVVLLSPTGSGKTLGFLLPVLNSLVLNKTGVQTLVVVPSRELALQIEQVFRLMGTGYKVNCCYGGHSTKVERNNLEQAPALLIGTPGRIADHIKRNSFDTSSVSTLVLDEFDKSLELGFQEDLLLIIQSLPNLERKILTSATKALEIPAFVKISNPVVLNFLTDVPSARLQLKFVRSTGSDKLEALFSLICKLGNKPSLIFCNHRDAVERISELLKDKGLGHDVFHGGLEQDERQRALIKFRNGSHLWLVTTDLASRGLDIPEIENVIHYQLPSNENAYVHRNGRTARMHAEGTSYLVLAEDEEIPAYIKDIPDEVSFPSKNILPADSSWDTLYVAGGKKDKINKMDIVGFLIQKTKLQKEELGLIEVLDYCCYVAVKRDKMKQVIQLGRNQKIKKKSVKIEAAR